MDLPTLHHLTPAMLRTWLDDQVARKNQTAGRPVTDEFGLDAIVGTADSISQCPVVAWLTDLLGEPVIVCDGMAKRPFANMKKGSNKSPLPQWVIAFYGKVDLLKPRFVHAHRALAILDSIEAVFAA